MKQEMSALVSLASLSVPVAVLSATTTSLSSRFVFVFSVNVNLGYEFNAFQAAQIFPKHEDCPRPATPESSHCLRRTVQ
jgi:hypothetical protein